MSSSAVSLAVIGVRNIGKGHLRNARKLQGVEVRAIADTNPQLLAEAAAMFDVPRTYRDAEALLAEVDVDGVILAVPNPLHAPLAIAALQAGRHVLVEKPIARTAAEAEQMIAARDAGGKILMVGMNQRLSPPHAAMKKALVAGAIGSIQYGRTVWLNRRPHEGLWGRGEWFLTPQQSGGGPMLDIGVHRLDLALHFMGFPAVASVAGQAFTGIGAAEAAQRGRRYEIEDSAIGWVRFACGACLTVEASYFLNTPQEGQRTELHGTAGSLCTPGDEPLRRHSAGGVEPIALPDVSDQAGSCVEHFVRVIRGQEPLGPTAEQAVTSLRIIQAIYQSAATGKAVDFA